MYFLSTQLQIAEVEKESLICHFGAVVLTCSNHQWPEGQVIPFNHGW